MRAKLKKYISLLLCGIMLIGIMPLEVFANSQKQVTLKEIEAGVGKKAPAYSFDLKWDNPNWTDGTGQDQHEPTGMRLEGRKALKGKDFETKPEKIDKSATSVTVNESKLEYGSIYEYRVVPYHTHTNGNNTTEAPNASTPETALFMTDIKVDVKGYGNTLEVTFDNPTYDGKNIFTGYKIYYEKGGSGVTQFNTAVEVKVDNPDLIVTKDDAREVTRLTCKVNSENIKPGNIYAVKVEPLYNGQEVRDDVKQIAVDGKQKLIAYNKKTTEYRVDNAYVAIPLTLEEDGKDYLKLKWGDISGLSTVGDIEKIEILSGPAENTINTILGTIHGPSDIINVNTWRISKPTERAFYKISIKVKSSTKPVESLIAMFDPTAVNITPNKPLIYPKALYEGTKTTLDLYWDTFTRAPYNEKEQANTDDKGMYLDQDVNYDVWVTDSLVNFDKYILPKVINNESGKKLKITNIDGVDNKVYNQKIEKYVTVGEKGEFLEKPIESNKVYYIKIIATKPTSDGKGLSSSPSIAQIYIPANSDIATPKSLSKPPFRVKKDEKGVDMITQTDVTVTWNTKWFEVYDDTTKQWYANASLRDGKLIYGKNVKDTDTIIQFYDKETPEEVQQAFKEAGYSDAGNILVRSMDISSSDIKYEMITVPFNDIDKVGGYEKYLEEIMQSENTKWEQINPKFTDDKYAEYTLTKLTPNTKYAIILRPYRMLQDTKKDAYPTYLLVTTLPEGVIVDITPTVPVLYEVDKTDTSIEVEWANSSNKIVYELAVDEIPIDDPSKAKKLIDSKEIKEKAKLYKKPDTEAEFYKYNIEQLFPDTGYYIWIRAKVDQEGGKVSDWSNPLYIKTKPIRIPSAPSGFGLASNKSVDTYNASKGTKYKPLSSNYLILEWLRDPDDKLAEPKADNGKGSAEALIDSNLKKTYMAKFNELIPNKDYYARAKTKLTITDSKDGGIEKIYSYIVEVSPYPDMKDAIEIEVPKIEAKGDRVISSESSWTTIFKYRTGKSTDGDYDGNIVDDLYPLPTEDFELVYDKDTKTLTYRFRSNKKDGKNNDDNLVDQRFISKLINNKVYNYNIDLTKHKDYVIKNRRVEIPYTIISALDSRKIALSITSGGTRFTLNSGFLNTKEVKGLGKLASDATVYIDLSENPQNLPPLNYNQTYATTPQQIKITLQNNGKSSQLSYLGSDMNVFMKLKTRDLTLENNVGAYRNIGNNVWDRLPSSYSTETGMHNVKTNRLGNYATITNGVKQNNPTEIQTSVNNKIVFTDAANLDVNSPISTVQFNNIVCAIIDGKQEVAINGGLSDSQYNSLKNSGMLLQGSVVAREAGINSLVKLYELKTKTKYEATENINTTPYKDIKNANKAYQQNLIKAGELGFYKEASRVNPKDVMTISQMLDMVDIILQDTGY